jgi:cyclophilin family peptidyl-prolyl cis-trans isomerase
VSGKQSKRERKQQRELERAAVRKRERQRTVFTGIVIGVVVLIGGLLIWLSLPPGPDEVADADDEPTPGETGSPADDRPVACGAQAPADAGEQKPTFDEPEQVLEDGIDYRAVIETSCGRMVLDLEEETAPEAVNSFVFLAQQGFFDGLEIFRNATGITALQTGAGSNDATWQIGYQLADELESAEAEGYPPGTVAMANGGPDTAGSQFFFVYGEGFDQGISSGGLQPTYARFATVTEGLDVLEQIALVEVGGERGETPQEVIYMDSVVVGGPEIVEEAADPAPTDDAGATTSPSPPPSPPPTASPTPTEPTE